MAQLHRHIQRQIRLDMCACCVRVCKIVRISVCVCSHFVLLLLAGIERDCGVGEGRGGGGGGGGGALGWLFEWVLAVRSGGSLSGRTPQVVHWFIGNANLHSSSEPVQLNACYMHNLLCKLYNFCHTELVRFVK